MESKIGESFREGVEAVNRHPDIILQQITGPDGDRIEAILNTLSPEEKLACQELYKDNETFRDQVIDKISHLQELDWYDLADKCGEIFGVPEEDMPDTKVNPRFVA